MIDTEALTAVAWAGAGFAGIAGLLYCFTCSDESPGFRLFPSQTREWVGYWFRTLELTVLACLYLGLNRAVTELVGITFLAAFVLLLASVVAFWRSDRSLCISGIWVLVAAIFSTVMFPAVS